MPRLDIRYRHSEIPELLATHAEAITSAVAQVMSTNDPMGKVEPSYVKLELTHAPHDINVRDISINISARALPGRKGREREIARTVRAAFVEATGGRHSVGVWMVLSQNSVYSEYNPE